MELEANGKEDLSRLLDLFEDYRRRYFKETDENHSLKKEDSTAGIASEFSSALSYPLDVGGKRIRPLLLLLTALSFSRGNKNTETLSHALPAALALECIHTYSLVHDDLPCMDNDNLRRGKPTTHVIYGEAKALLVGDALLTEAFHILAQQDERPALITLHMVRLLSQASGLQGMVYGQWLDMSSLGIEDFSFLTSIHNHKTGALLSAAFSLGFLAALNQEEELDKDLIQILSELGEKIGLSFQILDDILDVTQTAQTLGKTAQKDLIQNKLTSVSLLGLEKSQALAVQLQNEAIESLCLCFSRWNKQNEKIEIAEHQLTKEQVILITYLKKLLDRKS